MTRLVFIVVIANLMIAPVTAQFVGIGHTSPEKMLDIDGALKVRSDSIFGSNTDVDFNFIANGGFQFYLDGDISGSESFKLFNGTGGKMFESFESGDARIFNDLMVDGIAGSGTALVSADPSGILGRFAFSGNTTDVLNGVGSWVPGTSFTDYQDLGNSVSGSDVTITITSGTSTTFNDNDWDYNGTDIYNANAGEVGIGITSPTFPLHVQDVASASGVAYFYNQSPVAGSYGIKSASSVYSLGYIAVNGPSSGAFDGSGFTLPGSSPEIGIVGISMDVLTTNNYGVAGYSNGWAGYFENSAGNTVQLGGASAAIQIVDGTEASGNVLISDAQGYGSWSALSVDDADADPANEIQNLGSSASGSDRTITITGGTSTTIDIDDADADPANEIQNLSSSASGSDRTIDISGGTGTTIDIDDADADATNELQTLSIVDTTVLLTISGGNTVMLSQVVSEPVFRTTAGVLFTHPSLRSTVTWDGATETVTYTHGSSGFTDVTIIGSSGNGAGTNTVGTTDDVKTAGGTLSMTLNWGDATNQGFIIIAHDESGNGGFVMHCSIWSANVGGIVSYYY